MLETLSRVSEGCKSIIYIHGCWAAGKTKCQTRECQQDKRLTRQESSQRFEPGVEEE